MPKLVDDNEEENEEVTYKGVPKEVGPPEQIQFDKDGKVLP